MYIFSLNFNRKMPFNISNLDGQFFFKKKTFIFVTIVDCLMLFYSLKLTSVVYLVISRIVSEITRYILCLYEACAIFEHSVTHLCVSD